MYRPIVLTLAILAAGGCAAPDSSAPVEGNTEIEQVAPVADLDAIGARYLHLTLALGPHDDDWIDAYYGPPNLREEAEAAGLEPAVIAARATALKEELVAGAAPADQLGALRYHWLDRQLGAVAARASMLAGDVLSFDEESRRLYDAVAPNHDAAHYDAFLVDLEAALDEAGVEGESLAHRVSRFQSRFIVPSEKVDAVFRRAIEECKQRTAVYIDLPEDEMFELEFVTNQPWSGYNWYQGGHESLIQVNLDQPIQIDRAVDLACHEGYPGHHVYNVLIEKNLVNQKGWKEMSVYPLFSPQSLIAEGSANYGIQMAFPGTERMEFERDVLYPLAGLEPSSAEEHDHIAGLIEGLSDAGNQAARGLIDGTMSEEEAIAWLVRYNLVSESRAKQSLAFTKRYRSYVINYNLGKQLVAQSVEAAGDDQDARWAAFIDLLQTPRVASSLNGL